MFYGASLLYGASLISPRFSSWLVNELLVSVPEVTPRLYAKIIAKRIERKALDRLSHIRHTSTVFTLLIVDKTFVQYRREKERLKRSAEKNLKGFLNGQTVGERARRKERTNDIKTSTK